MILCIAGCFRRLDHLNIKHDRFVIPKIIQLVNIDTVKAFQADGITGVYPLLIGKFDFGDTINFSKLEQDKMTKNEYLWEVQKPYDSDTLSSEGLQIIPDYNTSVVYSDYGFSNKLYFPVYVINETYEPRVFFGKDRHGFAIQEAIDTSDNSLWHPIESTCYDFCGNGRFRKKLNPNQFLMFLMPKYSGSDTTSLRIRFKIGEIIYVSKVYKGVINPKQFDIDKKGWIYKDLNNTKGYSASFIFYGGWPKGPWK